MGSGQPICFIFNALAASVFSYWVPVRDLCRDSRFNRSPGHNFFI